MDRISELRPALSDIEDMSDDVKDLEETLSFSFGERLLTFHLEGDDLVWEMTGFPEKHSRMPLEVFVEEIDIQIPIILYEIDGIDRLGDSFAD